MFNKELFHQLKHEPGFSQAGIYILVGNASEETIYIGEADPVGDRLKNHVANKEGWVWGVYFFDRNHKIGKTEVQYLESALVALAKKPEDPISQVQPVGIENDHFDTIVIPAREEGFEQCFLNEHCWFAVRIHAKHHAKLKFIAAYQVAPIAAITHIAEIKAIVPYNNTGKYMIEFKGSANNPIPRIPRLGNSAVNMQSPRYALREKLLAAKHLDEIWTH